MNDEGSHRIGDMILVEAARCLKAYEGDGLMIGRLGGEEFGILLPGKGLTAAVAQLEDVRARIASIEVEGFSTTASSGIAEWRPGESLSDLLHRADLALLQAKRDGRNRVLPWSAELIAQ